MLTKFFKAPFLYNVSVFQVQTRRHLFWLGRLLIPSSWGFSTRVVLQGGGVSLMPNQTGGSGLRIYVPWRQDAPDIPPDNGYPLRRLSRYAWTTLGLFFLFNATTWRLPFTAFTYYFTAL